MAAAKKAHDVMAAKGLDSRGDVIQVAHAGAGVSSTGGGGVAGIEGKTARCGDQSGIAGGADRGGVFPAGSVDVGRRRWSGDFRFSA